MTNSRVQLRLRESTPQLHVHAWLYVHAAESEIACLRHMKFIWDFGYCKYPLSSVLCLCVCVMSVCKHDFCKKTMFRCFDETSGVSYYHTAVVRDVIITLMVPIKLNQKTDILSLFTNICSHLLSIYRQEAQLSQRDRAMLRIIEYFAKSLKFTQGHSKQHSWEGRKSPLGFHGLQLAYCCYQRVSAIFALQYGTLLRRNVDVFVRGA